jgi:hypothetical protein
MGKGVKRAMISLRSGAGVAVLAVVLTGQLWGIAAASPGLPGAFVSVSSADGIVFLSVRAQAAPLRDLLFEVARLAGFRIDERVPPGRTISVEFKGLPLDLALKRLLSAEDFIFVYDPSSEGNSAKLRWVILLGPASSLQGGTETAQAAPKDIRAFDPDAPLEQLLPLTDHQDPEMRRAALEALTLHEGDERARWKLMDQIRDPDPNIRSAVVGLLGPFVKQWPGAEDVIMTALRDPDPGVRRLALHTMWEASSPKSSEALQLGLLDADPGVRARAEELLRMRNTSAMESNEPGPGRGPFSPSEGP